VVAFEIARQIQAQAQPIGGLYLLDSQLAAPEPALSPGAADETAELIGFALALGLPLKFETAADLTLEEQYTQAVAYLRTLNPDQQLAYVVQQAQRARVVSYEFDVARARQALGMFKAHMQALKNYRPGLYGGPLILFTASERFSAQLIDGSSAWVALTRAAVRVCDVPGNHYTLLQEPQVAQLAAQLNTQLLTATPLR
jgi:thioesterase domain-containing protein